MGPPKTQENHVEPPPQKPKEAMKMRDEVYLNPTEMTEEQINEHFLELLELFQEVTFEHAPAQLYYRALEILIEYQRRRLK